MCMESQYTLSHPEQNNFRYTKTNTFIPIGRIDQSTYWLWSIETRLTSARKQTSFDFDVRRTLSVTPSVRDESTLEHLYPVMSLRKNIKEKYNESDKFPLL